MDFKLDIFPQGSLSSSVITTVWIGVWVVAFFNLRFGWACSGLVIPGYLVPLLLVKPFSAGTLCVQGLVTYAIVRLTSDWNPLPGWSSLFGRDRYFSLLLISIPVRLFFDGWLLLNIDAPIKIALGQGVHELGKKILPGVHRQGLSTGFYGKAYQFLRGKAEVDTDEK